MNDLKKINDELLQASGMSASLVKIGDDFVAAVSDLTTSDDVEEFMCPECSEWTTSDEPCCGIDRPRYCEDSINGDR